MNQLTEKPLKSTKVNLLCEVKMNFNFLKVILNKMGYFVIHNYISKILTKYPNWKDLSKAIWFKIAGQFITEYKTRQFKRQQLMKRYPIVKGLAPKKAKIGNALLDFIVDPFTCESSPELFRTHANYEESQIIVDVLRDFGFEVDVTDYRNMHAPKAEKYDLVIGQFRSFTKSCVNCRKPIPKIYLGWGFYAGATQKSIEIRCQELFRKRGVISSQTHPNDEGPKLATDIFYLGNDKTRDSYSNITDVPKLQLPNLIVDGVPVSLEQKDFSDARKHFMWMAAYGTLRRSLDVLLEIFSDHPEFELWVCGDIKHERIFFNAYLHELLELPNIHYQGWVDVGGEKYREITSRCGFMLYPSVSDGMPGSVINAMYAGLVPIVTPEAGMDCGGYGFEIASVDYKTIYEVMYQASSMSSGDLSKQSYSVHEFARYRYSRDAFKKSFATALEATLKRHKVLA